MPMPKKGNNRNRGSARSKEHATESKESRGKTTPADTSSAETATPPADLGGGLSSGNEGKAPIPRARAPVTDSASTIVPPSAVPNLADLVDTSRIAPVLIDVLAKVSAHPESPTPTFTDLATSLGISTAAAAFSRLTELGIRTRDDVRGTTRTAAFEAALSALDPSARRTLQAYVNLSVVSQDASVCAALIAKGYTDVIGIALTARPAFIAALRDKLGELEAAKLHAQASAQTAFLRNILTEARTAEGTGTSVDLIRALSGNGAGTGTPCHCDCNTAVSPLAYLADLLDYASQHLVAPKMGLTGDYFDNIDLTARKLTSVDPQINFNWGTSAPGPGISPTTFSVRWTGQVQPRYSEVYTFFTASDDGCRLWVDGQLIIDDWTDHAFAEHSGTTQAPLAAGQLYDIRLEYYQNLGSAAVVFSWQSASQQKEVVPQSQLYATFGDPTAPVDLGHIFHQPLPDLPVSCEAMNDEVRQVRICVEVLRDYLKRNSAQSGWTDWESLGGDLASDVVAARTANGNPHIFAVGSGGDVEHDSQDQTGLWVGWRSIAPPVLGWQAVGRPFALQNADGSVELFVRGNDHQCWHAIEDVQHGSWAWSSLAAPPGPAPDSNLAAVRYSDGRRRVFVVQGPNPLGKRWLCTNAESAAGGAWGGWVQVSPGSFSDPTAIVTAADLTEVFTRGGDNHLYRDIEQAGAGWSQDTMQGTLDGPPDGRTSVVRYSDGRLHVFTQWWDHTVYHNWQTAAGPGNWAGWNYVGGPFGGDPTALLDLEGRANLFVRGLDDALWRLRELPADPWWTEWTSLGGGITGAPAVLVDADGTFELFARGGDGAAYDRKQPLARSDVQQALARAEQDYRSATYQALLTQLGTSYDEIRLARAATDEQRAAIADRLGIDLAQSRPDHLDDLFLDPTAAPRQPREITDATLQQLFGLVHTTRDPLSDGVKLGEDPSRLQLVRWNLSGVAWNRNTDVEGYVYVTLSNPAAGKYHVDVYQDAARTIQVASGERTDAHGAVDLSPAGSSELAGRFAIDYRTGANQITISLVPRFTSWRLNHLRAVWAAQDRPPDSLWSSQPVVDPDVIGPDDFRAPFASTSSSTQTHWFDVWVKRRAWVDARLDELAGLTQADGTPDLPGMIGRMFQNVTYGSQTLVPWASTTQAAFTGLLDRFLQGNPPDDLATQLSDLFLTPASFARLAALYAKDREASNPKNEPVTADEWSDVHSILVQAEKGRFFSMWQTEDPPLGPADFWISLPEPLVGEWPPVVPQGTALIDPDVVTLLDLPEPTFGQPVIKLWRDRRAWLDQARTTLRSDRIAAGANGFSAILAEAYGGALPAGVDLDALYATLQKGLPDSDPELVQARATIEGTLLMSVNTFSRLMVLRAKDAGTASKLSVAEWEEVYAILSQVERKQLPNNQKWEAVEAADGITYWQAWKARLPRWRCSTEARQQWRATLRTRSNAPIIDPDLLVLDDLRDPVAGNAAYDLQDAREQWITTRLGNLDTARRRAASALAGLDTILVDGLFGDVVSEGG